MTEYNCGIDGCDLPAACSSPIGNGARCYEHRNIEPPGQLQPGTKYKLIEDEEMRFIGELMLWPSLADIARRFSGVFRIKDPRVLAVFETIVAMKFGERPDAITVGELMMKNGTFELAGGRQFLLDCCIDSTWKSEEWLNRCSEDPAYDEGHDDE